MLGPGRYLLGAVELLLLGGFAWLGAAQVRRRLLPGFRGVAAGLATAVLALALLLWCAEALGTCSVFEPVPYLLLVAVVGLGLWRSLRRSPEGGLPHPHLQVGVRETSLRAGARDGKGQGGGDGGGEGLVATVVALVIAAVAVLHFAVDVKSKLSTGMTGFDSTWYHGPFAAGFFQSGDTWNLHFIAPQFLAWFYPANGEIFHAIGMLAFDRDLLSPLLNIGWFLGCLVACWCIGRPFGVAPWSLALGAVALSVPALSDQAGEARNDIVAIFFLLAAVAVALNCAAAARDEQPAGRGEADEQQAGREEGAGGSGGSRAGLSRGVMILSGLAAGLAAGTKLNFLLPAAVLVFGLTLIAPRGARWRALGASGLAALAGGGYWYLRNLVYGGNPLPWIHHLGPITLPAPEQALGGREAHSVLGYLTDGTVWSDWFLPGFHHALWIVWPLLGAAALAGLLLSAWLLIGGRGSGRGEDEVAEERGDAAPAAVGRGTDAVLAIAGLVGLASALAWLIAPTSASGPDGMPRGFESGLRYLAPALILGLALLPTARPLRRPARRFGAGGQSMRSFDPHSGRKVRSALVGQGGMATLTVLVLLAVVVGYPVQRHYLRDRYADPTFTNPGLDAAFKWASGISGARIATTSTRQYPLFGTDLSNRVQFVGLERPHGGFEAPTSCRQWRRLLDEGGYDYVVASRDRLEPGKPPYPETTHWTEAPEAQVVLKKPPTVVFKLKGPLDPAACP